MIFLFVFCASAIITYPVAANPLTDLDDSIHKSEGQASYSGTSAAHASSVNSFIQHRVRREKDVTKAPRIIKYYDSDSSLSSLTVLSEDGVPLDPPIKYVNTAFRESDGYLVKVPKNNQNKTERTDVISNDTTYMRKDILI